MKNSISFIHAADLHLDSPFKGLTHIPDSIFHHVRESTFAALDNLVTTAINKQVDFVLLVGDLFDNENQSLKAQVRLRKAFEKLKFHHINVYLSFGNHDYINGNIHPIVYPDNVYIFPNENITTFNFKKNNEPVASIYGFSYENRSLKKNKSIFYKIQNRAIPFHIAMLHGTINGNKDHDPYAPFTLQDLKEEPFDYWALGHIHKRQQLLSSPPIIYPGNIQGRHRNESGEKGCYYVKLSHTEPELEFVPLQSIIFDDIQMDVSTCKTMLEIEEKIKNIVQQHTDERLIHLTIRSKHEDILRFETNQMLTELIDVVNESLLEEKRWSYIYTYKIQIDELPQFKEDDFFIGETKRAMEKLSVPETVKDLYNHPKARKYLEEISEIDIKNSAKQLLIHELLHVEEGD
ncbi:metallophosphoesterase family protein [Pseudogracilibacillus sp. SO30301A]|uniref:metallophosphoesterase family protein n=1 Tax=Pseudogracilibacillus sp. SO30301A TaxID=3098291 RepID=UPI00300DD4DE